LIKFIEFKRSYFSKFAQYRFEPNVKYVLKDEDSLYYYTIKNIRLHKTSEGILFIIGESSNSHHSFIS